MCPHANGDSAPIDKSEMVAVELNGSNGSTAAPAPIKKRGTTREPDAHIKHHAQNKNPYAARASDLISNISNFNIIESTLRGQ